MTILVTGGAGFIGSNFVRHMLSRPGDSVVTLDALTYAGNPENLAAISGEPRHVFVKGDIADSDLVGGLLRRHDVSAIIHFAAETHVDRSIRGPQAFIDTNVTGTFRLLETARAYWEVLADTGKSAFRFLHVSTDEVFGSLEASDAPFTEASAYAPNSPYAASKAASDHLVRAWHQTYGLPTLISNCSNNFGPFQFPEKLIPLVIHNALAGLPLPIYGDGEQRRDWLYVGDHCRALEAMLKQGRPGQSYVVGGGAEITNLDMVQRLCSILDRRLPRGQGSYARQIEFVTDRPGHDRRYALDSSKIRRDLGWAPEASFADSLESTASWYLAHPEWVAHVTSGAYRDWVAEHYS